MSVSNVVSIIVGLCRANEHDSFNPVKKFDIEQAVGLSSKNLIPIALNQLKNQNVITVFESYGDYQITGFTDNLFLGK